MTPDLRKRGRPDPPTVWTGRKAHGIEDTFICTNGYHGCGMYHRTEGAAKRHCEQLNRKEARRSA